MVGPNQRGNTNGMRTEAAEPIPITKGQKNETVLLHRAIHRPNVPARAAAAARHVHRRRNPQVHKQQQLEKDRTMFNAHEPIEQQRAAATRAIIEAKRIADGAPGATLSRDLETVTSGYAIGTASVEVTTRADLLELIEAILFVRRALIAGLKTNVNDVMDEWLSVGLWRNPSDGRVVTEITAVIPKAEVDEETAVEIGRRLGQSCIYDLDNDTEIPCSSSSN